MNSCVALGRGTINSLRIIWVNWGGERCPEWAGPDGLGRPSWAHFNPFHGFLCWRCFSCLLERSPFFMWALDVSFSTVWIEVLVAQAPTFFV
jgi:hypothetical protein